MPKTWSTPARETRSAPVPCVLCGGRSFKPALQCEGAAYVRCAACGLTQINPQPEAALVLERYSFLFGKEYLSYELENEAAFLKLQKLALEDAGFAELEKVLLSRAGATASPPSVLDAGCATGALLAYLRGRGWRCTGVEISPCAEYARKERGLDVRSLPLEENKFPAGSFDVILASHLIEHLNNPRSFLNEVFRALASEGRVFITTPNIAGFQARITGANWRSAIFDHLFLFSKQTLKALLIDTGFKIEGIHTWGGLAAGLAPQWLKRPADFLAKR
ncbi:MAG: class I SAM-dependent methyltransferase, partial [Treponema sp.]|nr:class I SAM-dependent methyltransferase [Treponema sp.]